MRYCVGLGNELHRAETDVGLTHELGHWSLVGLKGVLGMTGRKRIVMASLSSCWPQWSKYEQGSGGIEHPRGCRT